MVLKDWHPDYTVFTIEKLKRNKFITQRALIEFNALFLYAKVKYDLKQGGT